MVQRSSRGELVDPSRVIAAIGAFRQDTSVPLIRRLPINGDTYRAVSTASDALHGVTTALTAASGKILKARGLTLPGFNRGR